MIEDRLCWKCGLKAHMTRMVDPWLADQHRLFGAQAWPMVAVFKCDNCAWPSIGVGASFPKAVNNSQLQEQRANFLRQPKLWHPKGAIGKKFPEVPEHIAKAADEAHRCRSFDALRGSVILARAVIEATCKEKGITEGVLATKIDELATQRFIRPDTQEAAHEIRHFGNDMAHGDFVDPVGEDEADDILSLMDEVLDEVFQGPAKIARVKANRLAKKAAKKP